MVLIEDCVRSSDFGGVNGYVAMLEYDGDRMDLP